MGHDVVNNLATMKSKYLMNVFVISLFLASCRTPRFIYSPAPPNNPYFREKGESKLAAYYSAAADEDSPDGEYNNGFDLQAAYAVNDHWALIADYYKRSEKDIFTSDDDGFFDGSVVRYDRNLTNFGAGYFIPLTKNKQIVFNVFGGMGFGKFSFTDNGIDNGIDYSRYYKSNTTKWYIQPSLNFFTGKYLRTGLVGKFLWVHYTNAFTSYPAAEQTYFGLDLLQGSTVSYFEATWNMQATLKKISWLYLDGGLTLCPNTPDNNVNLETRNFNGSIGLSVDFSKMKKK
jgi:hypothetical protein